ncbi:MAG: peptidase [Chlorobia bacterium]|nr:peptidase [Fimbriimonadaceae bacterium]
MNSAIPGGKVPSMIRSGIFVLYLIPALTLAQPKITSPKEFFGHEVGADYYLSNYKQFSGYWRKLDQESDRMTLQSIGKTEEGRDQFMAIVTSPENHKKLKRLQEIAKKLCLADGISPEEAKKLSQEGKAVVWIDGGLHATETLGAQQLIETSWQMVSRTDDEAKRILDNVIILFVHANPDGMDLVSDWYMQESDPTKRNMRIPRLYQKYIGHDNNRDFYAATQKESQNMNKVMYREWFPQIMYNHHQTGPAGTVMFAPPFRDPFNHNIDPQVMTGIELVGSAMHNRFVEEGKPGVTMRTGASYSTWWNGGLRTTAYYHNMIGILTETIGSPTPMRIPFIADRLIPKGNLIFPIEPQPWKFRQSVDYSVTANMAILDLAAKRREEFLYGIYSIGKRQIEKGRKDTWTDYPSRVAEAKSLADLRKPEMRDAKAYIIPSGQRDMESVLWFASTLRFNGIRVDSLPSSTRIGNKTYPAGSVLIRCDQAYRSHILDMFEPQDHPNDFSAPGAPPTAPYDNAGYTLAFQVGIQFDRLLEPVTVKAVEFTGNLFGTKMGAPIEPLASNGSYELAFAQLRDGKPVWMLERSELPAFALESGTTFSGNKHALKLPRIALWDRYGGSMESGWTRWIMDKFGIPYKVVFPKELEAGNLNSKYDAIVFVDGSIPANFREAQAPSTEGIPEKYHFMLGSVNANSIAKLKEFAENGGSIITIGTGTNIARHFNLPIESYLVKDGKPLPRTEYYIPGSILQVKVDNTQPVAWGMGERADVMFDNSPVFKITDTTKVKPIAWFDSEKPLRSGWAWGQKLLKDGVAIAEAPVGKGKVYLFGPEILYRGQSHGTFKFFFNALLLSRAEKLE